MTRQPLNIALWAAQILLALAFGFFGFMKATGDLAALAQMMTWIPAVPAAFVRFIGCAEILGAIGMILPPLTRIKPMLTPLAALGFVTIASLAISAGLTYASICLLGKELGFALSLAGIAGLIVSVGITADSFVVYFERLKDEIKEGRTPRSAVDRAWVRARRTILSADTVSLLAAVILYLVSVGGVRGFAFTLGLSTLLDVVVVFLFTRPLISYLSRFRWFSRSALTGFFGPDGGQPLTASVRKPLNVSAPTTTQEA